MTTAVQIRAQREADVPPLSALEWKVVTLAMREAGEAGTSDAPRGLFARLFGSAVGMRPKLPLADPRLEALRRFVANIRDRADVSELKPRLIELGFHPAQITAVAMLAR